MQKARGSNVQFPCATGLGKPTEASSVRTSPICKTWESRTGTDLRIRVPLHVENVGKPSKSTQELTQNVFFGGRARRVEMVIHAM